MGRTHRLIRIIVAGGLAGALAAALLCLPWALQRRGELAAASVRQENLMPARGEAFAAYEADAVTVHALVGGEPDARVTVSIDGARWVQAQGGAVTLPRGEDRGQVIAAFQNRVVRADYAAQPGQEAVVALDIADAPDAPELAIFDVEPGKGVSIPLPVAGADDVKAERMPNGISLTRSGAAYALAVDGARLDPGFYPFVLTATNAVGQATANIGVRVKRDEPAIEISTAQALRDIRRDLSGHYVLVNDIDLGGVHDWTPIGTAAYPFTGVLDGGGHEITGFHAPERIEDGDNFSLLGHIKNAEVRGIIVREPMIAPDVPAREGNIGFSCCVFAGVTSNSLIEDCASIGGVVSPSDNYASGLSSLDGSIARGLFNSTEIVCQAPNRYLPNTGGLFFVAGGHSYVANCANEGDVFGRHLTGGITGYLHLSHVTRSVNSGHISGSTLVGEFPPGGIMQTTDFGMARDCAFVVGASGVGGKVFHPGMLGVLTPIADADLRNPAALAMLGSFDGREPDWAYASLDARGPVPFGVFRRQAARPALPASGNAVSLPPEAGVVYFYTLDGGDPRADGAMRAEALDIALKPGQALAVYAARPGHRDSETAHHQP